MVIMGMVPLGWGEELSPLCTRKGGWMDRWDTPLLEGSRTSAKNVFLPLSLDYAGGSLLLSSTGFLLRQATLPMLKHTAPTIPYNKCTSEAMNSRVLLSQVR